MAQRWTLLYILKCLPLEESLVFIQMCGWCSVVSDLLRPVTIARQASLSLGFSRQEYWSGLPLCTPGDLSDPGITRLLHWLADSSPLHHQIIHL